jgi:hypothetical protein
MRGPRRSRPPAPGNTQLQNRRRRSSLRSNSTHDFLQKLAEQRLTREVDENRVDGFDSFSASGASLRVSRFWLPTSRVCIVRDLLTLTFFSKSRSLRVRLEVLSTHSGSPRDGEQIL